MKSLLIILQFLVIVYALILSVSQEETIEKQQLELNTLRRDSTLIHDFFIDQSQKYEDFYVDYTNFKLGEWI